MKTLLSQEQELAPLSRIQRVKGKPNDQYEVIFLNRYGQILVPLTEWYRLRKGQGPLSTRETYLFCLLPFFTFLTESGYSWNAPSEQLRMVLIEFHRDRLRCLIHPERDREGVEIIPTRDTPICESTLRVMRAALRDFYFVMKDEGLYPFPNPLSSEMLLALKREQTLVVANRGAPDHAGIRAETHAQSRRRPTAFLRHSHAKGWEPELRKELTDVREGIHKVLDALLDSKNVSPREKAVLELLQNTGARLHEVVLMTVGGYRNQGIAGQAQVVNKGSVGQEIKTIYFGHNPKVEQTLNTYLKQMRPLHDPHKRRKLAQLADQEALFLTERGTPYSTRAFYWHWYKNYELLRSHCPVPFSLHDIRHLFISEYLIRLKLDCGSGTPQFDSERYLREREAFGSLVMGWSSVNTINIYDHTRDGEGALSLLATYQKELSQRYYVPDPVINEEYQGGQEKISTPIDQTSIATKPGATIWLHDAETLAWVQKMQQQKGAAE